MRVGGLVEPHVVFGSGGELALNAYLVFVAGLGEQGARPVAAFLVHAPDKVRLEVAVVAARRFGLGNPVVLGFLHVGVVLDDRLEGDVEVKNQRVRVGVRGRCQCERQSGSKPMYKAFAHYCRIILPVTPGSTEWLELSKITLTVRNRLALSTTGEMNSTVPFLLRPCEEPFSESFTV